VALTWALAFILSRGLKNRVLAQLRRLKKPRYLVATLFGLAYWWWYFGRALGRVVGRPEAISGEGWRLGLEFGLVGLALLALAIDWVLGAEKGALAFSEAEIQFLFPGPFTRRQLLRYRLLRVLATGLLGATVMTLVFGRSLGGPPLLFALGTWVAFACLSFHTVGAALARATLARRGLGGLRRKLLTAALVAGAVALFAWAARQVALPDVADGPLALLTALPQALDASPLGWVLWPLRAPVRLMLARSTMEFLVALPGALFVLGIHYAWVVTSALQFEDASIEEAQRRSRIIAQVRSGGGLSMVRAGARRRPPFRLAPHGRPEVALLWKGLIAGGRTFTVRSFAIVALTLAVAAGAIGSATLGGGALALLGGVAAVIWGAAVLIGPSVVRTDLRLDLPNLEALRSLPLTGADLLRGQLLAPLATVTAVQWLALLVATPLLPFEVSVGARLAVATAAALLGPALSLVQLTLLNGFVVVLPAWAATGPGRVQGPEALGMRLMGGLAVVLALALAVLPGAILGGLALGVAWPFLGLLGAPVGAAVAAAALFGECWVTTAFLGRVLERMDPSEL